MLHTQIAISLKQTCGASEGVARFVVIKMELVHESSINNTVAVIT
jgi:hypothetical protein